MAQIPTQAICSSNPVSGEFRFLFNVTSIENTSLKKMRPMKETRKPCVALILRPNDSTIIYVYFFLLKLVCQNFQLIIGRTIASQGPNLS